MPFGNRSDEHMQADHWGQLAGVLRREGTLRRSL